MPYTSLTRAEDYYTEGALTWLEADQLIRAGTRNAKSLDDFARRPEARDDQRHLVPDTGLDVVLQAVIARMRDLVDRERCRWPVRIVAIVRRQLLGDLVEPFVELRLRPRVQGREAADDPRLALRNHQFRAGDDEQRRSDQRQAQAIERGGKRHRFLLKTLFSTRSLTPVLTLPTLFSGGAVPVFADVGPALASRRS